MSLSRLILIVAKPDELRNAALFMNKNRCSAMHITPDIIDEAVIARELTKSNYKIVVMVDYPRGSKYGVDKFKGTTTDFFLADGYDIVLTPGRNENDINSEAKSIVSFIKEMVNPMATVCLTLNRSMREDVEFMTCLRACLAQIPHFIKFEANPKIQPSLANLEVHDNTVKMVRNLNAVPLVVCGNVNYKVYDGLLAVGDLQFAVSLDQAQRLEADILRKPDIYSEMVEKYPRADLEICKHCARLVQDCANEENCELSRNECPGTSYLIVGGLITRR